MNMRWKRVLIITGCLIAMAAAGCVSLRTPYTATASSSAENQTSAEEKTDEIFRHMTDREKIGQLLMIGIGGPALDDDAKAMLTDIPVGNVILFDRNMQNPDQVKQLNQDISQTIYKQAGVRPFIGVDQEGGKVVRMRDHFMTMPSASEVGKGTLEGASDLSCKAGRALRNMGFNLNFAPVADLGLAGGRSYGNTPEEVVPYAEETIKGYKSQGIRTTLKHFPGIGKVKTDPHIDGDVVDISHDEFDREDGRTFREIIKNTDPRYTFVMVSNVTYPQIDPDNPACISKTIMEDILRKEYGYRGIILTDDMEMGAMAKHYAFKDMGVKAIEAGADIVLVCHVYEHQKEVYNGLLEAYENGTLDRHMVDEKVKKIIRAKLAA